MRTAAFFDTSKGSVAGESAEPSDSAEWRVAAAIILLGATIALMLFPAFVALLAMVDEHDQGSTLSRLQSLGALTKYLDLVRFAPALALAGSVFRAQESE